MSDQWTTIESHDPRETIDFWRRVVARDPMIQRCGSDLYFSSFNGTPPIRPDWAVIPLGNGDLLNIRPLSHTEGPESARQATSIGVRLTVRTEDAAGVLERALAAGGQRVGRALVFRDLDGNQVEVVPLDS